jgi:superfamily II DNA or RNA helicase
MTALRPYQRDLIARAQGAFGQGARAVCIQSSTGSGKTFLAARGIIAPSVALGRRVIFLADLEEIILDTVDRLRALDIPCAPILDGKAEDPTAPVQVASQQTLNSWLKREREIPPADRVILDECHGAAARTTRELLRVLRERGALLAGLSGTPARGDGLPLDEFDALVCGPQPRELVGVGALVPCEVLAPPGMQEGVAMDPCEVILGGQELDSPVPLAHKRRAVIFAPHAAEAKRIARILTEHGHPTEAVLDSTPRDVRRGVRARLLSGKTRHVVTCRALVKGFDAPVLDCAVLTSQGTVTSYLQSVGRVLRPHPPSGKRDALVVDLRGAVYAHGLPLDDRTWSLAGAQGRTGTERDVGLRRCRACHAIFPPRTVCPRCGSTLIADPRPLRVQRAEMFAASSIPLRERATRYIDGTIRAMQARGMRPDRAAIVAKAKAPAWVREALSQQFGEVSNG